jgi:hypothetical protein
MVSGMNGCGLMVGSDVAHIVSLVDGYNLPMRISNNVGCNVAECAVDLGPNCPAALKGPFDASGFPLGCKVRNGVFLTYPNILLTYAR